MREARRRRTTKPMSHAMTKEDLDADPPQQVGVHKAWLNCGPPAVICAPHIPFGGGIGCHHYPHRRPVSTRHQRKDVCFSIEQDSPRIQGGTDVGATCRDVVGLKFEKRTKTRCA